MSAPASRVMFLGLDGGTWNVFGPWFERGKLPHLAALRRRSATGILRSTTPMVTPVAWTSFATGCPPEVHGIHEFNYLDTIERTIRSNHSGRVRVPHLWDILSAYGLSVVSLNLPMTYPPPRARGLIIAGADAPGFGWASARCPEFGREVASTIPAYSHKIVIKQRPRTFDELRAGVARLIVVFRARVDAALLADRRCEWTAMMVHFQNLDSLQHRLWPYLEVDETAAGDPLWARELERCMTALDDGIGRLLELASERDAAIVALSDHGFGPCRRLVNVNGLLRQAGLQRGLMYGTRFRYRASRLTDRFHRWLTRGAPGGTGRRLPRSIAGQVGCDWKRTAAFAPFGQLAASVYVNPSLDLNASRAERIRREVIEVLRAAQDPETGVPLFSDAYDVAERYGLDPALAGMPDVIAPSANGYQAEGTWRVRMQTEILRPDWNLPGTHWAEGVIAIDAPGVKPSSDLNATLPDIAPTVLAMLDLRIPNVMSGRVLHEAFEDPLEVRRGPSPEFEPDSLFPKLLAAGFGSNINQ